MSAVGAAAVGGVGPFAAEELAQVFPYAASLPVREQHGAGLVFAKSQEARREHLAVAASGAGCVVPAVVEQESVSAVVVVAAVLVVVVVAMVVAADDAVARLASVLAGSASCRGGSV